MNYPDIIIMCIVNIMSPENIGPISLQLNRLLNYLETN